MNIWRLPAEIDTEQLAPHHALHLALEAMARHCLEGVRPQFAQAVRPGDVIAAGPHFGIGSSREEAAGVLVSLGVAAVIAPSFGGLFYRNACNLGLLLLICPQAGLLQDGEAVACDARRGRITRADGSALAAQAPPAFLIERIERGGLLAELRWRLQR